MEFTDEQKAFLDEIGKIKAEEDLKMLMEAQPEDLE